MKTKYKIVLIYDGSSFHGWQRQTNTTETVQEKVEKALAGIFKIEISTVGSGRTDAKVHSLNQHVVFDAPYFIEPAGLMKGLNSHLPVEIRCVDCEILNKDLMPTSDAKSRRYRYLFSTQENETPFQRNYMAHFKYTLDFEAMREACEVFKGTHDFRSFMTAGSSPSTTVREIFDVRLTKNTETFYGLFPEHYCFEIEATGFLKQMVRLIVGAIIEVGRGKLTSQDIEKSLKLADGKHIAACAPPEGLCKALVRY